MLLLPPPRSFAEGFGVHGGGEAVLLQLLLLELLRLELLVVVVVVVVMVVVVVVFGLAGAARVHRARLRCPPHLHAPWLHGRTLGIVSVVADERLLRRTSPRCLFPLVNFFPRDAPLLLNAEIPEAPPRPVTLGLVDPAGPQHTVALLRG